MADLISRMATLSMGDGNVNEKGEFLVKGGPRNGPIVWNPTTAYIESWNQLPLHPILLRNLERLGYAFPEPVQRYALKPLVVGECDGKIVSLTGSGKTLAFSIPLVNKLLNSGVSVKDSISEISFASSIQTKQFRKVLKNTIPDSKTRKPQALVLVPTREIANQVKDVIKGLLKGSGLVVAAVYSNPGMKLSYNEKTGELIEKSMSGNEGQSNKLKKGANVIVATPGQLVHYMNSHIIRAGLFLEALQTFCIDESDQLLMPSKSGKCNYFNGERKIIIDRKEFGNLEGQLMAILHNMKLLDYAIQKKADREIEVPKPQVILTSAQLQTDDNRTVQDIVLNPKIDPSRKFQKTFMLQPVDIIKSHMVNDQPVPQLHRAVDHKFILCKPYDESLTTSKKGTLDFNVRKPIITADSKKNELVIALLKQFVADRKAIMIFAEQKADIENLTKLLLEREHDWNPSVSPNRQIKYKTVFNKYEGRTVTLDLVENMKDSKLVKVSSFEDQQTRERAIVGLRNGSKQVLISTNVCSRGLDLPNIDMVINYCMPEWHDGRAFEGLGRANNDFIYRIGRMCRVGQQVHGKKTLSAVSFFSPSPENQNWSKGQNPIIAAKQIHGHGPSASERMVPFIFNEIFQFNNIGDLGDAAPFIEAYYNKVMESRRRH